MPASFTYSVIINQDLIQSVSRTFERDKVPCVDTFIDSCPLEEAINSQTDLAVTIHNNGTMTIWGPHWKNPFSFKITYARALDFIQRWRSNKSVKPFDFNFELCQPN
jgi:hypothetical protein